jgi:5-methylcytosine-specific restriction endonuclease McrA
MPSNFGNEEINRLKTGVSKIGQLLAVKNINIDSASSSGVSATTDGPYEYIEIELFRNFFHYLIIYLDDSNSDSGRRFYCGFSDENEKKINKLIEACPSFANVEIKSHDASDWIENGSNFYRLREPILLKDAANPIRDCEEDPETEALFYAFGLYQARDEDEVPFFTRAAEFVQDVWTSLDAQTIEDSKTLLERAKKAEAALAKVNHSRRNVYSRDPYIAQWARKRANAKCECCEKPAPFTTYQNQPYLEVHHIKALGENGLDSTLNVAAICPTCHRKIHHSDEGAEINNRLGERVGAAQKKAQADLEGSV